jgi:hypothetical protein
VPTVLVVGTGSASDAFYADWTLRRDNLKRIDRKRGSSLVEWHSSKLRALLRRPGFKGFDQRGALTNRGYRLLSLTEIGGLYFVGSGGNHRVAAAHQNGVVLLRADVTHARLAREAPIQMRRWLEKTRYRLLEGNCLRPQYSHWPPASVQRARRRSASRLRRGARRRALLGAGAETRNPRFKLGATAGKDTSDPGGE